MALQANELRIGNWIRFDNHILPSKYIKVTTRFFSSLAGGRNIDDIPLNEELNQYHKPIPLTEDILIATGFEFIERKIDFGVGGYYPNKYWFIVDGVKEYRNGSYPIYKHGFCVGSYKNKKSFYYQSYRHETIGTELKYIHQLQNLYFALTGEELQISL